MATIASLPWLRGKNARQNTSRPELAGSGNDLDGVRHRLDRADRDRSPLGGSDSIDNGSIEQAGKVRHFGLSEAAADTIRRAHAEAKDDYRLKRCMAGQ